MISWPWDSIDVVINAETGYPEYDRTYTAEEMREVLRTFFSNGVFTEQSDAFTVTPGDGMEVRVSAGRCFIQGDVGVETSTRTLSLMATTAQPRYDTIVLRWDNNVDVRAIDLYVKQGTPAEKPSRPSLTRTGNVYELGICDIYLPSKSTEITADRITDTRLESARCGTVQPFGEIDTTTFFNQIQTAVDKAVAAMKDALDGTTAGHLQSQIDDLNDMTTGINLLRGTRDFDNGNDSNAIHLDGFDIKPYVETVHDIDGFTYIRVKSEPGSHEGTLEAYICSSSLVEFESKNAGKYTFSCDVSFDKPENLTDLTLLFVAARFDGDPNVSSTGKPQNYTLSDIGLKASEIVAGKWYRVSVTVDPENLYSYTYISVRGYSAFETGAKFKRFKLEKGAINNPLWSASPFDIPTINGTRIPYIQTQPNNVTVSLPANQTRASTNITFPQKFKEVPNVIVYTNTASPLTYAAGTTNVTESGFTLNVQASSSQSSATNVNARWVAIGYV